MKKYIVCICIIFSKPVFACFCEAVTVDDYAKKCDYIVASRLEEAHIEKASNGQESIVGKFEAPSEIFKGNPKKSIGLKVELTYSSCQGFPEVSATYLVCAKENEFVKIGGCSLTIEYPDKDSPNYKILYELKNKKLK